MAGRRLAVAILALVASLVLAGCSRAERADPSPAAPVAGGTATDVRLGYFPNVTHAAAMIGVGEGLFAAELGGTTLTPQTFNAGGDAVNALLGGSLDITYIGSGPAINAFAKSGGGVTLIAGATSGGAQLVVRPDITDVRLLRGTTLATPQLGNTQDVALKVWLADNGLTADSADGVSVANLENPRTFDAFVQGSIDGAWLPEPWSSRLVLDAGARVLLDERSLWPGGEFPTTVMIVRAEFLQQYPETVRAVLRGHLRALDLAADDEEKAKAIVNAGLVELTGNGLRDAVIDRAFAGLTLGVDPLAVTFPELAGDSVTAGVTDQATDTAGFIDVGPLNAELEAAGRPVVSGSITGGNS